jgi:GT2 family glycosyltransferase
MNVHIISVAYGLPQSLRAMWDSVDSGHNLHWHLFRHSQIPDVVKACDDLARRPGVTYYPYGINRGLAKSVNEGMIAAFEMGADLVVNIADDMQPRPGDFDELVEYAYRRAGLPAITATAAHERTGTVGSCELSFTAFNLICLATVGMLDENFFPLYYEDVDFMRRVKLAGYPFPQLLGTRIVHRGSGNIYGVPGLLDQNHRTFAANQAYYIRKWGGLPGQERFSVPFQQFDLRIAPTDRGQPYPGFNRHDFDLVEM